MRSRSFFQSLRCSAALTLALALCANHAHGQPSPSPPPTPTTPSESTDQALAQGLFEQAMELMKDGRYGEACPKLAESHRLDPGGGTVFNLAICLEKEGKTASAYVAYDEALARAVKDANREREASARDRLAQLKPLLSKIVIQVSANAARVDGLDVRLDGVRARPEAWGTRVPVDPGVHILTATAPSRVDVRQEIRIDEAGKVYHIGVPDLALAEATTTNGNANALSPSSPRSEPPKNVSDGSPSRRSTLAYVLLATGGAFVVAGGVSGVLAANSHATSNDECPNGPTSCTRAGVRAEDDAARFSWGANIGIGLGLVAVGVGVYLLLTTPPQAQTPRGLSARKIIIHHQPL